MFVRRALMVREALSFTAICEPIFLTMWDPQHLTPLENAMACYRDSFTYLYVNDVRTSQNKRLRASTVGYGEISFFICV
jgi:hypothetical protein